MCRETLSRQQPRQQQIAGAAEVLDFVMKRADVFRHRDGSGRESLEQMLGRDDQVRFFKRARDDGWVGRARGVIREIANELVRRRCEVEERERHVLRRQYREACRCNRVGWRLNKQSVRATVWPDTRPKGVAVLYHAARPTGSFRKGVSCHGVDLAGAD